MNTKEFTRIRAISDLRGENQLLRRQLFSLKSTLSSTIDKIESVRRRKATEQRALFSVDKEGRYKFQRIIDLGKDEEEYADEEMNETVLIMTLPDHESLDEFDGF